MWWVFAELAQRLGQRLSDATARAMAAPGSVEAEDGCCDSARRALGCRGTSCAPHRPAWSRRTHPAPGWLVPDLLPGGRLELCPAELADQLAAVVGCAGPGRPCCCAADCRDR